MHLAGDRRDNYICLATLYGPTADNGSRALLESGLVCKRLYKHALFKEQPVKLRNVLTYAVIVKDLKVADFLREGARDPANKIGR